MGTYYMLPNSQLKGFKLELLAVAEWLFKSMAFLETVLLFTEDHGEITNPAAYNITITKCKSRSHAAGIPPCPYYLNIKPISLAPHARQCSLLWAIAAMLGTDTVVCFYFTRHSSGSAVIQQSLSMPNTCRPASNCPSSTLTTTGNQHTNPLWSQNGSRTIAWHLQRSHEVAKSMSYSVLGNNSDDNVFILLGMQGGSLWWSLQHFNRNHTPVHREIMHTCIINQSNHSIRSTNVAKII